MEIAQQDHDNIITLIANVKTLTEEVRLMRDDTRDQVKTLQRDKLDAKDFNDYKTQHAQEDEREVQRIDKEREEDRVADAKTDAALTAKVDKLMSAYLVGLGILGTIQFILPFVLKHFGLI